MMLNQPLLKALLTTRPSNQLLLHKQGPAASWAQAVLTSLSVAAAAQQLLSTWAGHDRGDVVGLDTRCAGCVVLLILKIPRSN